jgi:hypothetical protein
MRRPSRPPVVALAAAALLAIVVAAACGVSADDKPRAISRSRRPTSTRATWPRAPRSPSPPCCT